MLKLDVLESIKCLSNGCFGGLDCQITSLPTKLRCKMLQKCHLIAVSIKKR